MTLLKKISYGALITLGALSLGDFCQKQTKGFRLQNLIAPPTHPNAAKCYIAEDIKKELESILCQPFYFLKKGQQCFTFASADGEYVLKLLRWEKLEPSWVERHFYPQKVLAKAKKKAVDFASYQLAHDLLKKETALIHLSLYPSISLSIPFVIYDNLYIPHHLSTDQVAFILQKKGTPFFPIFQKALETNQIDKLIPFFTALIDLLKARTENNISDPDISLEYNIGILEGKPLLFDIGNLQQKPSTVTEEITLLTDALRLYSKELTELIYQLAQEKDKRAPLP